MIRRQARRRSGLSLLEVLIALAIFLLSVVVISQMVSSAAQRGLRSKRMTQAAILCQAKMDEIVAGTQPLQSAGSRPLEGAEAGWAYTVVVEPQSWSAVSSGGQVGASGLNTVHVTVVWTGTQMGGPVEFQLSRLVMDPQLRVPAQTPTSSSSTPSGSSS
jgi:prepilin-type N-terminal cleavage/methylation domain-containing protein